MAMALFSKEYFKQQFFGDLVSLSSDIVPNVRLKLCTMMPRLKSLLSLPSDKALLQRLEATVKDLLLRETDADVLFALQTSIQDLDGTDTGMYVYWASPTSMPQLLSLANIHLHTE